MYTTLSVHGQYFSYVVDGVAIQRTEDYCLRRPKSSSESNMTGESVEVKLLYCKVERVNGIP